MNEGFQGQEILTVLGGGFRGPAELSRSSIERTRIAVRLYQESPRRILFCGGATRADTELSEAQAMADLAVSEGLSSDHVLLETRSRNTWENAAFTVPILREHGGARIVLVTSPHHVRRALLCFRAHGLAPTAYRGAFPAELVTRQAIFWEYAALARLWFRLRLLR